MTLNRDLRMARELSFKKHRSRSVVFSFRHPDQGLVTYTWTLPENRREAAITRSYGDTAWVIGRNISDFEIKETDDSIRFRITAMAPEPKESPPTFTLDGQVIKR